ncbi:response regulator [Chamaesiphon polymorphus]|uniref:response regulator n=1 Tax=Chamaesiphon polymorphus TaxID=2107691 RepID=UPI001C63330E|nr:response regulator [Chamaesiphon polymorphus]
MTNTINNSILNILLVEDDEVDVMNVQRAFEVGKITSPLYVAGNGIEALEMLRGKPGQPSVVPPDRRLILLDLNMPKMNGLRFLQELRADEMLKHIPVVVFAASNEESDKIETYGLNVAGYIHKPTKFTDFVELLVAINDYWKLCEMN